MCEMDKTERRIHRDQDPPRIRNKSTENLLKNDFETSKSTPNSPTGIFNRDSNLEKFYRSDPDFFKKRYDTNNLTKNNENNSIINHENQLESKNENLASGHSNSTHQDDNGVDLNNDKSLSVENPTCYSSNEDFVKELTAKVPSSKTFNEVVFNDTTNEPDSCIKVTNGKEMAPVLGVPPPPPAPHMGPDGLILPRKPNNPYLDSNIHRDLHRELKINQKVGKNVLNQKSELQRALEKQREAASRKEADRIREESFKDDPRTALQRAIEQRARHIRLAEEPRNTEPPNPLVVARAKLRTRTDSQ